MLDKFPIETVLLQPSIWLKLFTVLLSLTSIFDEPKRPEMAAQFTIPPKLPSTESTARELGSSYAERDDALEVSVTLSSHATGKIEVEVDGEIDVEIEIEL